MPRNKEASANVKRIVTDDIFEKRLHNFNAQKEKIAPKEERLYGPKLNMMGRNAYFEEYFYGIKLEDQVFPKVGKFDDPREAESFKFGYARGEILVRTGVVTEELYSQEKNNSKHR